MKVKVVRLDNSGSLFETNYAGQIENIINNNSIYIENIINSNSIYFDTFNRSLTLSDYRVITIGNYSYVILEYRG